MLSLTDMTLVSAHLLAMAALALKDKREDGWTVRILILLFS